MPLAAADRITGLIFAGGRGRCMGGTDRGLVAFQGQPLVAHAVESLAPQVVGGMISANRNFERYRSFASRVVGDSVGDCPGPLAGIEAGLAHAPTAWMVVVPCDAPRLPRTRLADVGAAAVDFEDGSAFRNLNLPEALAGGGS